MMAPPAGVFIQGAVEGLLDEEVLRRLILHVGASAGAIYGKEGKQHLLQRLPSYNRAARQGPWVVLIDLDRDEDCAPPFVTAHLPAPSPMMCCRVAVRSIETWLIADREHLAALLDVATVRIPPNPEALPDPKRALVELAGRSHQRDIREDMVPRPGGGRRVGPAYTSRLIEFVKDEGNGWRPEIAAAHSDSLYRCLRHLRHLMDMPL